VHGGAFASWFCAVRAGFALLVRAVLHCLGVVEGCGCASGVGAFSVAVDQVDVWAVGAFRAVGFPTISWLDGDREGQWGSPGSCSAAIVVVIL